MLCCNMMRCVKGSSFHGLVGTDSLALLADDDPELDLVVELLAAQGDLDLLPRSDVGGRRLDINRHGSIVYSNKFLMERVRVWVNSRKDKEFGGKSHFWVVLG